MFAQTAAATSTPVSAVTVKLPRSQAIIGGLTIGQGTPPPVPAFCTTIGRRQSMPERHKAKV